jgi:hypothetical protein
MMNAYDEYLSILIAPHFSEPLIVSRAGVPREAALDSRNYLQKGPKLLVIKVNDALSVSPRRGSMENSNICVPVRVFVYGP